MVILEEIAFIFFMACGTDSPLRLKFHVINRFAKRKLDDYPFLGNLLQVTYAPDFEDVQDTITKLEERRRTVMNRLKSNTYLSTLCLPIKYKSFQGLHSITFCDKQGIAWLSSLRVRKPW